MNRNRFKKLIQAIKTGGPVYAAQKVRLYVKRHLKTERKFSWEDYAFEELSESEITNSDNKFDVSVVVPTYNGGEQFATMLQLLKQQKNCGRNKNTIEKIFTVRYGLSLPVYSPVFHAETNDKKSVDNPPKTTYIKEKEPPADLSEDERTVLALLTDEPEHIDQIVSASGMAASRVTAAMTMLQIKQLAKKQGANYFVRI